MAEAPFSEYLCLMSGLSKATTHERIDRNLILPDSKELHNSKHAKNRKRLGHIPKATHTLKALSPELWLVVKSPRPLLFPEILLNFP